jgi:integrase
MMHLNRLTDKTVKAATEQGRYADGGGLYLQVSKWGTKAWLFRYMTDGKARQMGLGSVDTFSLKEARERARTARQMLADGIDPIEHRLAERDARRAHEATRITFKDAAKEFIAVHEETWSNAKHRWQWRNTLETVYGKLGDRPVSAIDDRLINETLAPIWVKTPVTASRVKDRIKRVVNWVAEGKPLPQPSKTRAVKHHAALPYAELPEFMVWLRGKRSISAKALEFTILTAARTGETLEARWGEIDLDAKVWTVPGARTKSGRQHRVPLSDRAQEILNNMPREKGGKFVFPGSRAKQPLSNMAMLRLLKSRDDGLTTHGFRSSFRDWCAEQTNYPRELAEAALAHALKDKTEAAYQRGDLLDKRRRLMDAWTHYCASPPAEKGKVVSIRGAAS